MITGKFLSTVNNGSTWFESPKWVTVGATIKRVADMAARKEWHDLISANPPTYREWREPGTAWVGRNPPVKEPNPEPEDNIMVAAVYLAGTDAERAQAQRESIRHEIEIQRSSADVRQIDLRADAGRAVLMDEAISQSESKINQLAATADADLDAFDATFDPQQIGSIATAASLYIQTERRLATDPTLTAQQISDLENLRTQYQAIASGSNDAAPVPVPTDNVRLKLGVVAEGFGTMQCRRIEQGGWWWLEFEVRTDRELSVSDYWIAVYDGNDTYLTTPFLTDQGGNRYTADKSAVNLPHNPPATYKYALCHQHISNQMFDPVVLDADVNERIDSIRWGGNAS